jgi:hypothetical protein
MKKVFPLALAICFFLSFSVVNPVNSQQLNQATAVSSVLFLQTDGVLQDAPGGPVSWHISATTVPLSITFSRDGQSYGPYSFSSQGGNVYMAGGPNAQLGIIQSWVNNGVVSFVTVW